MTGTFSLKSFDIRLLQTLCPIIPNFHIIFNNLPQNNEIELDIYVKKSPYVILFAYFYILPSVAES
jgi:hypothetical protein